MAKQPLLFGPNGKPVSWGLYPSPRVNGLHKNRTRFIGAATRDTRDAFSAYDWREQLDYSRQLFASFGDVAGGIREKNNWSFGAEGWRPKFIGKNKSWGDAVEVWLEKVALPNAVLRGEPFDFQTALMAFGIAIDVDGDQGTVLTEDENHFPKIQFIPAHRITSAQVEDVIKGGWADGAKLRNGVIINRNNATIGYRVQTAGNDSGGYQNIPIRNMTLHYEPVWQDQDRGIPRIATCLLDSWDMQDIGEFLKSQVKRESKMGLIRKTLDGNADNDPLLQTQDGNIPGSPADIDDQNGTTPPTKTAVIQDIRDTDMWELLAGEGEEIEAFKTENPSPNTEAFVARITRRILYNLGWPFELLDASKIGGANTRLIIELAKQSISTRQRTGLKLWRRTVNYFVAKGMKEGFIPKNYDGDDAYHWSVELPAELTVDQGNDEQADRENMKIGSTNLAIVCAKKGRDWKRVREQTQRETEDLVERAIAMTVKFPQITFEKALELLSQRTPNGAPQPANQEAEAVEPDEEGAPTKKKKAKR